MTKKQFKDKYFESSNMAARLAKESNIVKKMEKILKNKDFDEIERIFNLYAVMKQERDIAGDAYMLDNETLHVSNIRTK